MISPGTQVIVDFTTQDLLGEAVDADAAPVGTFVRNGEDTAETVTVTHKQTGVYRAAVTVPADWAAGDVVQIRMAAQVDGVAGKAVVWTGLLATVQDLLEADRVVDTAPSPWNLVHLKKNTGGLGSGTELLRQQLKDVTGDPLADTATVVGRIES